MVANHPTTAEVSTVLSEQGIAPPSTLDKIVNAVITDFEAQTGYAPFLGSSTAADWTFDPPSKIPGFILDLEGGFWDIDEIVIGETTLTTDDYDLLPLNAANESRGWNEIRFLFHPGFEPAGVVITGKRGYAEELPDDVYEAEFNEMLRRATLKAMSAGGERPTEVKQGMMTVKLASGENSTLEEAQEQFDSTILKYRRF